MKYKSVLLAEASGSVGGSTWSHNWAGKYIRERVTPTNPNTPQQQSLRSAMNYMANRWKNTLTAAQRDGWTTYAANVGMYDRLGAVIYLTALNHYVRSNFLRATGLPPIDNAPTIFNIGSLATPTCSAFVQGPPSTIDINFDITDDWYLLAGGKLAIYAARPQLTTVNFFKGPYRWCANLAALEAPPRTVTLPFNVVLNQRIFLRARARCLDGRTSADVFFCYDPV